MRLPLPDALGLETRPELTLIARQIPLIFVHNSGQLAVTPIAVPSFLGRRPMVQDHNERAVTVLPAVFAPRRDAPKAWPIGTVHLAKRKEPPGVGLGGWEIEAGIGVLANRLLPARIADERNVNPVCHARTCTAPSDTVSTGIFSGGRFFFGLSEVAGTLQRTPARP